MPIVEIVFSPRLLIATAIYISLILLVEIGAGWLLHKVNGIVVTEWILEHIILPLSRAAALMLFLIIAYPLIFGITAAPPLSTVLNSDSLHLSTLINVLFLVSLLLPIIPVVGNMPAFLLPLQGAAGAALLFSWLGDIANYQNIDYLPSVGGLTVMLSTAYGLHLAAKFLSLRFSTSLEQLYNRNDTQVLIYRILIVIFQIPVILIYATQLGAQIAPS